MIFCDIPSSVRFVTPEGEFSGMRSGETFEARGIRLSCPNGKISVSSLRSGLLEAVLTWNISIPENAIVLGDAWERSYSELRWKKTSETGVLPWYFLWSEGGETAGFGVMVRPAAFCSWQIGAGTVSLCLNLRCGSEAVELRGRELDVCTLVAIRSRKAPFAAAREFCGMMCTDPRLPKGPVFGGNDWYCCYGENSFRQIVTHAGRIAECSPKGGTKPYMVVDDGWELCRGAYRDFIGGPWLPNRKFGDMKALADGISGLGVVPGIWFRPLQTAEFLSGVWTENAGGRFLDPSSEDALAYVQEQIGRIRSWGFRLLKHDFSTFDITGRWGPEFGANPLSGCGPLRDKSRTTAEIILRLYRAIREAAGDMDVLGCNVVGHLSAGIFEAQRTGDDTSGREWERTVAMGVNTLAYRMPQHNTFFAADADCVGITKAVPWENTAKWLDLLSVSGTPLFVSIAEDAYDDTVREAVTKAFARASAAKGCAEPLDWTDVSPFRRASGEACAAPQKWLGTDGLLHEYKWF